MNDLHIHGNELDDTRIYFVLNFFFPFKNNHTFDRRKCSLGVIGHFFRKVH